MAKPLPPLRALGADEHGWGFFLCAGKDVRQGRAGEFLSLTLKDATGAVPARVFDRVAELKGAFDAGQFVKVHGRSTLFNGQLQLVVDQIRRVIPDRDRADGFREEDCVPAAPRPLDEMWRDLTGLVAGVGNPFIRTLLERVAAGHEARLRIWPAAQTIHHAYRGGFLEHMLQIARVGTMLADAYGADRDLLVAGAVLHDIGKLRELSYDGTTSYSTEGRLLGHIAIGLLLVREEVDRIDSFPGELRLQIEHLVLSHHGSAELGSPVAPMTVEAYLLSVVDDLDAKLHQIRRAIDEDISDAEFTPYQQRFGRAFYKGPKPPQVQ